MAKSPDTPPRSKRPTRRSDQRGKRSIAGKLIAGVAVVGAAGTFGGGFYKAAMEPPAEHCGGAAIKRWPVKVTNDPDAKGINLTSTRLFKVAEIDQAMLPEAMPTVGRMQVEKQAYTVHGFLSFWKKEDDQDYHVVIADQAADYSRGTVTPNGRSLVVEFPDPHCFAGSDDDEHPSLLKDQIAQARSVFERHTKDLPRDQPITDPVPVTVTGIGFFDADHGHQVGRSTPRPVSNRVEKVVFELHPVIGISFDNDPEPD